MPDDNDCPVFSTEGRAFFCVGYNHSNNKRKPETIMPTIELQLPEETWQRARRSAEASHATVEEWLVAAIERTAVDLDQNPILGLFSQEPDVVDTVMEDAMTTREQHTLRLPVQT
jgi:hypothetical protein